MKRVKTIFNRTDKELEESFLRDFLEDVVPGDEVGAKRAAKTAAQMTSDFRRLLGPVEPEQ